MLFFFSNIYKREYIYFLIPNIYGKVIKNILIKNNEYKRKLKSLIKIDE